MPVPVGRSTAAAPAIPSRAPEAAATSDVPARPRAVNPDGRLNEIGVETPTGTVTVSRSKSDVETLQVFGPTTTTRAVGVAETLSAPAGRSATGTKTVVAPTHIAATSRPRRMRKPCFAVSRAFSRFTWEVGRPLESRYPYIDRSQSQLEARL
jgi:hypothetical protein